ncbi:MAG: endonuclease III, partial [Thermoplasmata archaeon]|nr:endonuclease III [Thermoplasmata archaeon]
MHRNPFELLIATILSAQTTDKQVNNITPALFKRYRTPEDFACADIEEIERYIRSIGLYHSKAKYIKGACMRLVGVHDSRVP